MFRLPHPARLHLILTIALVIAVATAVQPALAVPHPHKQLKQQIEELEQQWRTATLAGDTSAMDKLLSDDYVGISWNGEVNTKAMQIDRVRNRTFVISRLDLSDSKVKLLGSVAIVTSRADVVGSSEGSQMIGIFRYTRVYQRLPSGNWKITNFEATRVPDSIEHRHHGQPPAAIQPASTPRSPTS
jgi:ketosteroid isomerase-like protein